MGSVDLDEAAEELYAEAPDDFLAARGALVARAREDGDKALAAAIGKLRKPSTAAWLVNLLAYEAADDLAALLDLGAAMRHAQSRLSGAELRRLTQQRHQVVRALATQAHHLAADRGERVSRTVLDQVTDTLLAALADPEAAEQVRAGHLTTPLSYSGFGPAGLASVPAPVEPDEQPDEEPDEEPDADAERERAEAERQRRLEEARTERSRAESALATARRKVVRSERSVETSTAESERGRGAPDPGRGDPGAGPRRPRPPRRRGAGGRARPGRAPGGRAGGPARAGPRRRGARRARRAES